ncbi:hypothetical protein HPB50_011900 [Hyalomma asiaticum]|uniref:Uncharacterized protein n=1 Tax=Hyalomma asiaticum TaxID=266040 RepID=A0ACB7SK89_HYAAI|nr:hypothetical protein HPB50_011900 [Hyalomma asiaticum]
MQELRLLKNEVQLLSQRLGQAEAADRSPSLPQAHPSVVLPRQPVETVSELEAAAQNEALASAVVCIATQATGCPSEMVVSEWSPACPSPACLSPLPLAADLDLAVLSADIAGSSLSAHSAATPAAEPSGTILPTEVAITPGDAAASDPSSIVPAVALPVPPGSCTAMPQCSFTEDRRVHLANAVHVARTTYDQLMGVPKDSHFVKRSAVAICSTEVLAQRSFTGTLSAVL